MEGNKITKMAKDNNKRKLIAKPECPKKHLMDSPKGTQWHVFEKGSRMCKYCGGYYKDN